MGLLDRPDSTLLLVIMGVCIVGLLALAVATFFPGISRRVRPGGLTDAYPTEPVNFAGRLSGAGYDADPSESEHSPLESVTVVEAPKPARRAPARKKTAPAAKKTSPTKTSAKSTAKRTRAKSSPQD